MTIRLCLLAALGLTLALPLTAAPARADDPRQFFDEYDADSDGCVTPEEFRGSSEIFKLIDKNGDGVIKPEDLGLPADYKPDPARKRRPGGEAGAPGRGGEMDKRLQRFRKQLAKMDKDQDGRVSQNEWMGPEQAFARIDRNKDGFIDAKDMPDMAKRGDRRGGKAGPRDGGAGKGGSLTEEMKENVRRRAAEQFGKLDENADGKVTADEVPSPMLLELADANGDGHVTLAEFQKVHLQRAMRRAKTSGAGDGHRGNRRRGGLNAGTLKRWDRDGDGKVSSDEFPGRDAMFERLDADGDGYLTEADIDARRKKDGAAKKKDAGPVTPKTGTVIERMDTDGDGRLHRAEFTGSADDWERLDRNGDGWITADELVANPKK